MKAKYMVIFASILIATGCQNSSSQRNLDEEQKIYIHETTKNYGGLIELYKSRLQKTDTIDSRVKLAQAYYLATDYDSAERVLSPIMDTTKNDNTLVLYGRILAKTNTGQYDKAIKYLERAAQINPKNGEAYNLLGIIQIKKGQYDAARFSFNQARELFYDENKVINNLAMISILDRDYLTAYQYLNILYNKGYRNNAMLHNIVYTLVKLDKTDVARKFCVEHKLSNYPTILIEELKKVEPNTTIRFNEIVPTSSQMKIPYATEKKTGLDIKGETPIVNNVAVKSSLNSDSKPVPKTFLNNDIKSNIKMPLNSETKTEVATTTSLVAVRSGEHPSFSRITFETNSKLNHAQYLIHKESDNRYQIQLLDIDLSASNIEKLIKTIKNSNRNFTNVTAQYGANKTLVLTIDVKNISNFKVFYAGTGKKGHCIAIDFYITH